MSVIMNCLLLGIGLVFGIALPLFELIRGGMLMATLGFVTGSVWELADALAFGKSFLWMFIGLGLGLLVAPTHGLVFGTVLASAFGLNFGLAKVFQFCISNNNGEEVAKKS